MGYILLSSYFIFLSISNTIFPYDRYNTKKTNIHWILFFFFSRKKKHVIKKEKLIHVLVQNVIYSAKVSKISESFILYNYFIFISTFYYE